MSGWVWDCTFTHCILTSPHPHPLVPATAGTLVAEDTPINRMARKLKIDKPGRHIFLCSDQTKAKCCSKAEGLESWDYLKMRVKVS